MKGLESGKDKIQKICNALKKETLEPARQEAREIIENAHMQASQIVVEAEKKAKSISEETDKEIEEKKRVFQASLNLASRQGVEQLKQKIEKDLFSKELSDLVVEEMESPQLIAKLINRFIESSEEKGIEGEFSAFIPKEISPRAVNELLTSRVLGKLKDQTVVCSDFDGGAQIQIREKQITVDISDAVVRELISKYIRKDLRDLIFDI